jgi:hypothetical protein
MASRSIHSRVWAITSYFPFDEPAGARRRLAAFRQFRACLGVPLAAVELAPTGRPHLDPGDAEILVRAHAGDLLWQKERLLNVALDALPDHCDTVAWIDCDVVLGNPRWPDEARERLRDVALLQPFRRVFHLSSAVLPAAGDRSGLTHGLDAVAWRHAAGTLPDDVHSRQGLSSQFRYAPGMAWAASRDLLDRHGLYDAAILGSGDKLMFSAACGRIDEATAALRMTAGWRRHFRQWAEAFHGATCGRIGHLEGDAWHLWHGDLRRRGYADRYAGFEAHDFDPAADLRIGTDGAWHWNSDKPPLHAFVRRYFATRATDTGSAAA